MKRQSNLPIHSGAESDQYPQRKKLFKRIYKRIPVTPIGFYYVAPSEYKL